MPPAAEAVSPKSTAIIQMRLNAHCRRCSYDGCTVTDSFRPLLPRKDLNRTQR